MSQININITYNKSCGIKCNCWKYRIKRCKNKSGVRHKRSCKKKTVYTPLCKLRRNKVRCPIKNPKISIRPIVKRYFFVASEDMNLSEGIVILSHQFVDDRGYSINKFSSFGKKGYFNVYVNGVMQEGKLYCISSNAIKFIATEQIILCGTPIIVELVGFTAKLYYK